MDGYYIYRHIRLDTNQPFYIGKGHKDRAYSTRNRNPHWHNIVKLHGYEVEIILENLTEDQALNKEVEFIKLYRDFGCKLANLTNGGEGQTGLRHTEQTKQKLSQAGKGRSPPNKGKKASPEQVEANRQRTLAYFANGGIHPMQGRKQSPESIERMRKSKLGKPSPDKGKKHSLERIENNRNAQLSCTAKPVYSHSEDFIYPSLTAAATAHGFKKDCVAKAIKRNQPLFGMKFSYLQKNNRNRSCLILKGEYY
jgi:hypothetical protein